MHFDSLPAWLSWQESLHPQAIDLGLDRVGQVFCALNPKRIKLPTITVAGTNGKGSCIAFLEAIYRTEGYRVGAYTSPHLVKYNERIRIDGQPVSDQLICEAFSRIETVRVNTSLSYFEFGTLAALDIFWRSDLDVQLLEVGLGGRLDAVNIIDPDVTLITSICIDHVDWLGETREAIGREKAGIFRRDIPAVIGDPAPPQSLFECAADTAAPMQCLGKDFDYLKQQNGWDWSWGEKKLLQLPRPALQGEHQYRNAASVLVAVETMQDQLPISDGAIRKGLESVCLAGRFQLIKQDKVPILLDVGHNPQAVQTLVEHIDQEFPGKRIHAIFSMMKNKDIMGVVKIMNPIVWDWFLVPLTNPRSAEESMLREVFQACSIHNVNFGFDDFSAAFTGAKNQAEKDDLILIFGSFFLVSEYLAEFQVQ